MPHLQKNLLTSVFFPRQQIIYETLQKFILQIYQKLINFAKIPNFFETFQHGRLRLTVLFDCQTLPGKDYAKSPATVDEYNILIFRKDKLCANFQFSWLEVFPPGSHDKLWIFSDKLFKTTFHLWRILLPGRGRLRFIASR